MITQGDEGEDKNQASIDRTANSDLQADEMGLDGKHKSSVNSVNSKMRCIKSMMQIQTN